MSEFLKKYINKCFKTILGNEYSLLEDFFDVIRKDSADYIIFISRRCFILYQIFTYINNCKRDNVISDKGIWTYQEQIREAHRIILADDILFWGTAMKTASQLLNSILNPRKEYEIKRVIYCRYAGNKEEGNANIQTFSTRSMRECKILTNKLAKSIMLSGFPYTTFLYPFYGNIKDIDIQFDKGALTFKVVKATEGKWKSYYDFKIDKKLQGMLDCLCDGAVIRYYYQPQERLFCIIPFAFISNIKIEYLTYFYHNISECCQESGWTEIANDIEVAIAGKSDEKWIYLAMLLSCLLSRIIGVVEHIDKRFEKNYEREISKKSLEGIFSSHIYKCLDQLSEENSLCFVDKVVLKREIWNTCLLKLSKKEVDGDSDMCLDDLLALFSEMRRNYEISHNSRDKIINGKKLYELYSEKYSYNIIQAAQIECCDVGIVSYGFEYDDTIGTIVKFGIGERSSVIVPLKYADIIHQYYIDNSNEERRCGELTKKNMEVNLAKIFQKAQLSEEESNAFLSYIHHDIFNMYDNYLNE